MAVGTLLAAIYATDQDALDTLSIQWTGTTPVGNAGVFSYNNNTGKPRLIIGRTGPFQTFS